MSICKEFAQCKLPSKTIVFNWYGQGCSHSPLNTVFLLRWTRSTFELLRHDVHERGSYVTKQNNYTTLCRFPIFQLLKVTEVATCSVVTHSFGECSISNRNLFSSYGKGFPLALVTKRVHMSTDLARSVVQKHWLPWSYY